MKKAYLAILAAAAVALAAPAHAQNTLLANPSFELDADSNNFPDNWAGFDQAGAGFQGGWTTAFAQNGLHSVRFDNRSAAGTFEGIVAQNSAWTAASPSGPHEFLAVTPGATMSFSGFALNDPTTPITGAASAVFQLEFYNSTFGVDANLFNAWGHSATLNGNSLSTSQWTQFSTGNVVVPTGAAYAKFTVVESPNGNTGSFYVDNLAAVPEPSSLAMWSISGLGLLGMLARRKKA
ncbi:MAG: PEP-CTERM sorting domain-containing protein [Verrucomicrobiae bacterium]|nr:PEP-CTERM sorting domain-containing protein [Verrucomicrobiae bacterium]